MGAKKRWGKPGEDRSGWLENRPDEMARSPATLEYTNLGLPLMNEQVDTPPARPSRTMVGVKHFCLFPRQAARLLKLAWMSD